ncbi:unnamed protein product [Mytilus edulis]|uniref:Endonuclease/exonuclease/phosphatase domain-containing protein n=1 Tax=Mytilus edulis TaxID=6550 RepID=A0A8S3RDR5_MYTED|nr:unnamed protein product [Mytilus edulis]
MLLGDLNAHVKCDELDFITNEVDDTLDDFLPVNYEADCIHKLRNTEIPQSTNNYVGQYCPTLSDHCPISVQILSQSAQETVFNLQKNNLKRININGAREEVFKANILCYDFSLIIKEIDTLVLDNDNNNNDHNLLDPNSPLLKGVNETVSKVSSMLYNAAFVGNAKSKGKKGMKRRKIKKPYYDGECETMYRNVKCLSRRLCETPWDKTLRLYVLQQKKEYNKLVRKKYRNFRQKVLDNILEAEKRNPQEFWKAINTLKSNTNSDPSSNITHQEWFEYFKKLMNVNQNDNFSNDNKFIDQFNSDILNYDMTTEEEYEEVISSYEIGGKIATIVSDNAANMIKAFALPGFESDPQEKGRI